MARHGLTASVFRPETQQRGFVGSILQRVTQHTVLRQRDDGAWLTGNGNGLEGQDQAEMRRFLPRGSEWLFDGGNMADMANAFAGIVQDNAKALRLSLTRTVG